MRGSGRLRWTANRPSAASFRFEPLKRGQMVAQAEALDGESLQPELARSGAEEPGRP